MHSVHRDFILVLVLGCLAHPLAHAAEPRWDRAKVVHFHAVGLYNGQTVIAHNEPGGQATVTDRLTLDFDWDVREEKLAGAVRFGNEKSASTDFRNVERSCPAPKPHGEYEHLTATEARNSSVGGIEIVGQRSYPLIDVTAFCRGSWVKKTVPAKQEQVNEFLAVPRVELLGMPGLPMSGEVAVSPDGKSIIMKAGLWTWTMTPNIVASR